MWLARPMTEIEILCIDDGSEDATSDILNEYQRKDSRIQIIRQKNRGYGYSVNLGFKQASGKYVAIVEADDFIEKNMMASLYEKAEAINADVVKADYYMCTGEKENRQITYMQIAPHKKMYGKKLNSRETTALFYAVQMSWEGIYKKEFLEKHQILHHCSPGAAFQDNGFWFQVFTWAESVYFVNQAFYYYRTDNEKASTKQRDLKKLSLMFDEYDFIRRFIDGHSEIQARVYPVYYHFRFVNLLSRFFCAAEEARMEIVLRIHDELKEAVKKTEFSWELMGTAFRMDMEMLLTAPKAFAENPPYNINELCWAEVQHRPQIDGIDGEAAIPANVILDYVEGL